MQDISGIPHSHPPEALLKLVGCFSNWACRNRQGVSAALEYLFSISSHSLYLGVDELERRVIRPIELVDLKMVYVERYLAMAMDASARLGYNLESVRGLWEYEYLLHEPILSKE